jgi:predicted dehydrogenase
VTVRFAVIGINHGHIYGMVAHMLRAGAEFVTWYAEEEDLSAAFASKFDTVPRADSVDRILEDESIHLILSASIASERAPLGVRAMRLGKDVIVDKPGMTSLGQLEEVRRMQAETGRIYSVCFSEHYDTACTVEAGRLVQAGAIGKAVQTLGSGPHRAGVSGRPEWFFQKEKYGGILTDIGSHQAEQFLFFTGSTEAEVVSSTVANYRYPQYPELEDFGEMSFRGNGGHGYVRLDWYTPDGLSTWGDGRLVILGTEGYIELRKYVDVARERRGDHLFLVDQKGERYIDCAGLDLPYGRQLVHDIQHRTWTHTPQERTFLAMELALKAEATAVRLGNLAQVETRSV